MGIRVVVLSLVLAATACASKVHVDNPDPFPKDDPRAYGPAANKPAKTGATVAASATARVQTGTIERTSLNEVLARGLGAFLSGIEVQAYFDDHKFAGWEVVRFWPQHATYSRVDIRPGDVVLSINDHALERPTQVQKLWQDLRTADTVVVRGMRLGTPFKLRFEIRGSHNPAVK